MFDDKNYWEKVYKNIKTNKIQYDLWLDKFEEILKQCKGTEVIDIGCGTGNNSLYLYERGFKVLACDYSKEALKIVNNKLPYVKTKEMDLTKDFPFENHSIKLIIADLCLHYFSEEVTKFILNELKRVIAKDGYLIFRVNSITDFNYGAGTGIEIEKHYYDTESGYKRFFDEDDIKHFCVGWKIEYLHAHNICRYGMEKQTYEVVLKN